MTVFFHGPYCFPASDVVGFRDWVNHVHGFAIAETDAGKKQWGSGKSRAFNLIHSFKTRSKFLLPWNSWHNIFTQTWLCLFISHHTKLSFIRATPVHTAKHFTSCWCHGCSHYLFLNPQKSGLTPVFMIKLWLLGRHLDSCVINDWSWIWLLWPADLLLLVLL